MGCSRLTSFMDKMVRVKPLILEAIHLLATGRSFRTHIPKNYIQNSSHDAIVFAQSLTEKIGMPKNGIG